MGCLRKKGLKSVPEYLLLYNDEGVPGGRLSFNIVPAFAEFARLR
jgi:hypothetical protein